MIDFRGRARARWWQSGPMATTEPVNLAAKLAQFAEHWAPRTVDTFNGHDVMVVKVQREGDPATAAARTEI